MSWYATRTGDGSMNGGYVSARFGEWDDGCPECERIEDHAHRADADERPIASMEVGDSGHTVHWALNVDDDGRCWLNPNHAVLSSPFGTASMYVDRRTDGFHVRTLDTDGCYASGFPSVPSEHDYLPVQTIYGKFPRPRREDRSAGPRRGVRSTERSRTAVASTGGTTTSTVADMRENQIGYTDPSAVLTDYRNQAWIRRGALIVTKPSKLRSVRVKRRRDGFHVQSDGAAGTPITVVPDETMLPVQSLNGNYRDVESHAAAVARAVSLVGVEEHLSLDFKRKAKDKGWPTVEMTRAVTDALNKEGWDASWEKVRERLVSTAPIGTLEGGIPVPLPAPSVRYCGLRTAQRTAQAVLIAFGLMGLFYMVSDPSVSAAVLSLFVTGGGDPPAVETGAVRTAIAGLAGHLGIDEGQLPSSAVALFFGMTLPGPRRPVPPPAVPDNYWKELVKAVRTNRTGMPAATSSSTRTEKDSSVPIAFEREFYNKPTLFRVTGVQRLRSKFGAGAPDIELPTVDFIVLDHATGTFEERRDITLRPSRLSKWLVDAYRSGAPLVAGYAVLKPTRHGNDVLDLAPLLDTDQDAARLHRAAAEQFAWWSDDSEPASVSVHEAGRADDAVNDTQRKVADAKAALASLDEQWLDFTTVTTPDGLRAYYFEMPALWRRPAAPAVTEYETALFELRELLDALPAKAAAEDADRASRAAEHALTAWSDAQQYAISIGIDDGRSVEEASAARQLPKLLAQFLDPSTGAAQATRLRTIIEQQMRKLTTRPAAEHMDAVNAGALHLHRAPVLAAIER